MQKGIFNRMRRRIGSRQCHRDKEIRRRETEQDEHQQLALPTFKQVFEHGDRTLPGEASSGNLHVHGQRAKNGDENKNQSRKRRNNPRSDQRNARLIPQR